MKNDNNCPDNEQKENRLKKYMNRDSGNYGTMKKN